MARDLLYEGAWFQYVVDPRQALLRHVLKIHSAQRNRIYANMPSDCP